MYTFLFLPPLHLDLFFPLIMVVHTYPSQDFSLEHNQHPPRSEDTKKLVTKLYQASTTRTWLTTESTAILGPNTPSYAEKITLPSVTTSTSEASIKSQTPEYYYYEDEGDDVDDGSLNKSKPIDLEDVEEEEENIDEQRRQQYPSEEEKLNDIKRSAEDFSKASEMETLASATTTAGTTTASAFVKPKSNYTNFTESLAAGLNSSRSPSPSQANNDRAIIMAAAVSVLATSVNSLSVLPPNNVTVLPHAPSTPQIVKTHRTATDWLRTMDDMVASAAVTSAPLSVSTTDANDDKFPFTLENVHKSEDLRRDENEPRRRQSKGLSAEYKPPGYINYSPESKNLLTRSASTTVNDYDSEENNISSEALSVQVSTRVSLASPKANF